MKKFLNVLFNVFWVLIVGLVSAISSGLLGVACCVTIIGIPLGLQYFKFVKLVFAPAGKIVVTKYSRHPVMNTFWLVFGGFLAVIIYFVIALLLCVTIVGIPLAKQLFKIMKFMCAPFGSEILKDGEYSKKKNLTYDMKLLNRHICANPQTALAYLQAKRTEVLDLKIIKQCVGDRMKRLFLRRVAHRKAEWNFCKKHLQPLVAQYPNNAPLAGKKYYKLEQVLNYAGLTCRVDNWKKLNRRICADYDRALPYISAKHHEVELLKKSKKRAKRVAILETICIAVAIFVFYYVAMGDMIKEAFNAILLGFSITLMAFLLYPLVKKVRFNRAEKQFCIRHLYPLMDAYPVGLPLASKKHKTLEAVLNLAGLSCSIKKKN